MKTWDGYELPDTDSADTKICPGCGKQFNRAGLCDANWHRRVYCSRKCHLKCQRFSGESVNGTTNPEHDKRPCKGVDGAPCKCERVPGNQYCARHCKVVTMRIRHKYRGLTAKRSRRSFWS